MDWHKNIVEDDDVIRKILKEYHTTAVVGIKDESRVHEAAHSVPAYLHSRGYHIIPVNPHYRSVFGISTLPSLREIKESVDIVQIFRSPKNMMKHANEALKIKPKVFWMQTGIRHQEAAHKLASAGIIVIQDRCMYMEHLRLLRAAA